MENLPKYKKKMKHIIRQTGVGVEKKGRQGEKSENVKFLFVCYNIIFMFNSFLVSSLFN